MGRSQADIAATALVAVLACAAAAVGVPPAATIVLGIMLVAAGAVGLAVAGAARQPQPGFTQLWLSPQRQDAHTLSLGVTNDQGRTTSYRLVLRRDGRVIDSWNLTLGAGRTWQRSVPFTGK